MTLPYHPDHSIPPACRPTLARLQAVLDGELLPRILASDPHLSDCPACAERILAARLFLRNVPISAVPPLPAGFSDAVLAGIRTDRRTRLRRRVFAFTGGLAAAAAVIVAVVGLPRPPLEVAQHAPPPPGRVERLALPESAPEPPLSPIRIREELARAGDVLVDSSRPLTASVAAAPRLFATVTDPLLNVPTGAGVGDLRSVRESLAGFPEAAQDALEPVRDSVQETLTQLKENLSAMRPKPKS